MNLRLLTVIVATILLMAFVLTGVGGSTVAVMIAVVLVFVLPGYALVKALFPESHLETAELIALMLGLSLAITAIGGVVLYWLGWELNAVSWTLFLGSVTVLAGVVGILRHRPSETPIPEESKINFTFSFWDVLFFMLAAVGVAISFSLAYQGEIIQNNSDFTQLWILPDDDVENTVLVGINNHAEEQIQYRLDFEVDGQVVEEISMIDLQPAETWEHEFALPELAHTVTANLYRWYVSAEECSVEAPPEDCQQNEEVYREVVFRNWVYEQSNP